MTFNAKFSTETSSLADTTQSASTQTRLLAEFMTASAIAISCIVSPGGLPVLPIGRASVARDTQIGGWTSAVGAARDTALAPFWTSVELAFRDNDLFWPGPIPVGSRVETAVYPVSAMKASSSAVLVRDLHENSGLTWDQLARLFGVSRRALHHWASGGKLNVANEEQLRRLTAAIGNLKADTAAVRRALLLQVGADGISAYDRLRSEHGSSRYDVAGTPWRPAELLGVSNIRRE